MNLIGIDNPVIFLLPFDRYSLTLSHRLLDSMGGVSRFLLRAIEQELSLAALIEVTALSEAVLLNQLAYLQAHRYVKIEEGDSGPLLWLTLRGASIVQVDRLLQSPHFGVWLDAFTLSRHAVHMVMFDDDASPSPTPADAAPTPTPTPVVVQVPRRPGRGGRRRLFDDASRLRLLLEQHGVRQLLEHCWGADCELIASESEHWEFELDFDVGEQTEMQVAVEYAEGELQLWPKFPSNQSRPDAVPLLTLPVIELTQTFRQAAHFPWLIDLPPVRVQRLELVSAGVLSLFDEKTVIEGDDARHCKLPIRLGDVMPSGLGTLNVPPGICVEASIRSLHLLCSMDEEHLSRKLQYTSGAFILSHNLMTAAEAELA